ncbi:MAG: hypothetical protein M0R06_26245 [Sphaerochaeta sp.]|nr:hypothetical protein [Sphaerochaeta sp.]
MGVGGRPKLRPVYRDASRVGLVHVVNLDDFLSVLVLVNDGVAGVTGEHGPVGHGRRRVTGRDSSRQCRVSVGVPAVLRGQCEGREVRRVVRDSRGSEHDPQVVAVHAQVGDGVVEHDSLCEGRPVRGVEKVRSHRCDKIGAERDDEAGSRRYHGRKRHVVGVHGLGIVGCRVQPDANGQFGRACGNLPRYRGLCIGCPREVI